MFIRAWKFHAAGGREQEFESVYGPRGRWAQLFATCQGYVRTDLLKADSGPAEYLALDFWESREAWDNFLRASAREYEELDRECAALTDGELLVGEYTA